MQTYKSLFDEVTSEDLKRFYAYKGTVEDILEDLKDKNATTQTLLYHPTRLIKGLIDYKILHPENTIIPNVLRYLIEMTKEIYSIHSTQQFKLTNFKLMLMQNGLDNFLSFEVVQEEDAAACLSSVGNLTQKTAQKLYQQTGVQNILLIPIAHGATAPGFDLCLRYNAISDNNFSTIYPCRLSAHKHKDAALQITENEMNYLKSQAMNKKIVLFEENVVTGTTLTNAASFLKQTIFPDQEIIQMTNLNISKQSQSGAKTNSHEEILKQFLLQYEDPEISS